MYIHTKHIGGRRTLRTRGNPFKKKKVCEARGGGGEIMGKIASLGTCTYILPGDCTFILLSFFFSLFFLFWYM